MMTAAARRLLPVKMTCIFVPNDEDARFNICEIVQKNYLFNSKLTQWNDIIDIIFQKTRKISLFWNLWSWFSMSISLSLIMHPLHPQLTKNLRDAVQLIDVAIARKERLASDHLSIDTTGRPDVDLSTVSGITDEKFRRPIPSRCHVIGAGLIRSGDVAREAEIAELDYAVWRHQHVLRLYITMHDLSKKDSSSKNNSNNQKIEKAN